MLRVLSLLAPLLLATTAADAQVSVGVRTMLGGGAGHAPRPIYNALAGLDAQLPLTNSWAIGVAIDRLITERPNGPDGTESQINLTANYSKLNKGNQFWFAIGAGVRQFRTQSADPLLGAITVRGINVFHGRMGINREILPNVRLGFAFDWTMSVYVAGHYDDPSEYTRRHDKAPPKIDAISIGGIASMYTFGPRLSVLLD